jgi:nicotinamidase-related amidase
MFIDMKTHIPHINAINTAARGIGAPVIFTTVAYHKDYSDAGTFGLKVPLLRDLYIGSEASEIDPRVPVMDEDHLITKKFPSAFYGTNLQSQLTGLGVDTTIIVGNSTSGCVRATACDAVSGGFKPIVPSDCVADRAPLSHQVNLFDMDSKYADVMPSSEVLEYLNGLASSKAAAE